jgi:hypothetical protein
MGYEEDLLTIFLNGFLAVALLCWKRKTTVRALKTVDNRTIY